MARITDKSVLWHPEIPLQECVPPKIYVNIDATHAN